MNRLSLPWPSSPAGLVVLSNLTDLRLRLNVISMLSFDFTCSLNSGSDSERLWYVLLAALVDLPFELYEALRMPLMRLGDAFTIWRYSSDKRG